MTEWSGDELSRIGAADEVEIAGLRRDGTLRSPRIVWVVRHGDRLFVRSVNGPDAAWFRGIRVRDEGRVSSGGIDTDVTFVDAGRDLDAVLDEAYRTKYRDSPPEDLDPIRRPLAQSATVELVPRPTSL